MVQEIEHDFRGKVIDMAIQGFTDAKRIYRLSGSPAYPMMRKILSASKVGP